MKKLKNIILAALITVAVAAPVYNMKTAYAATVDTGISYNEITDKLVNPERGFYKALSYKLSKTSTGAIWAQSQMNTYASSYGIVHLRFGLENYSTNAGGADSDITPATLQCLGATLDIVRKAGSVAIVRFSYDVDGAQVGGQYKSNEPSLELIERHIEQLGEVLAQNTDVVSYIETGMLGPWGEQHSTTLATAAHSDRTIFYRIVEAWLKVIPKSRSIGVRRPLFFIHWANEKYSLNLTTANLGSYTAPKGTNAERVGVYNDGYLGSVSDLGTFVDRPSETGWLQKQAKTTFYGGEVVADSVTGAIGDYNNINYISTEAFKTHTTYLNIDWNYSNVIRHWETGNYTGADALYSGLSAFKYVENHLGYRIVIRDMKISAQADSDGVFQIEGSLENRGFGNIINEKNAHIILRKGSEKYSVLVPLDFRKLESNSREDFSITLQAPASISAGAYEVYLKVSDKQEKTDNNLRCIQFANKTSANGTIWYSAYGANRLGSVVVPAVSNTAGNLSYTACEAWSEYNISDAGDETEINVTFNGGEGAVGENPAAMTGKSDGIITLPANPYSKEKHTFGGWSDGTSVYTAGGTYICGSADVEFTAVWNIITYTVVFSGGGGTLASGDEVQQVAVSGNAVPPVYTRDGYILSGWSVSFENITEDTAITALWQVAPATYNVKFDGNGGTLISGTELQVVNAGEDAEPPVYEREGYTFNGWSVECKNITQNLTVRALWKKNAESNKKCGATNASGLLIIFPALAAGLLSKKIIFKFFK